MKAGVASARLGASAPAGRPSSSMRVSGGNDRSQAHSEDISGQLDSVPVQFFVQRRSAGSTIAHAHQASGLRP